VTGPSIVDQSATTMTIRVPLKLRRRGGRKLVLVGPSDDPVIAARPRIDSPVTKALVRAHRWRGLLETGAFDSIAALAAAEHVDKSYLSKVLRLTLLAPDLVERILGGTHSTSLTRDGLLQLVPAEWNAQRRLFAI